MSREKYEKKVGGNKRYVIGPTEGGKMSRP